MLELILLLITVGLFTCGLVFTFLCLDTRINYLEKQTEIFEKALKDKLN